WKLLGKEAFSKRGGIWAMRAEEGIGEEGDPTRREINRRTMFAGLVAATAAGGNAAMAASAQDRVRLAADELAASMRAAHGGSWIVHIDHDSCIVSVFRDLS